MKTHGLLRIIAALAVTAAKAASPGLSDSLTAKLDHQFEKYDSGRGYLVEQIVKNNVSVTREEWDAFLAPDEGFELTDQDIDDLRSNHNAIIAEALGSTCPYPSRTDWGHPHQ